MVIKSVNETGDLIRAWLKTELMSSPHGTRQKLAKHLGVNPSAISRMLNDGKKEVRQIKAYELYLMEEFFKSSPFSPRFSDGNREEEAEYFDHMTRIYGLNIFRDLVCTQVAGHSNLVKLDEVEWRNFAEKYHVMIDGMRGVRVTDK